MLVQERVEPGDAVWIPSGVVHALGAGCTVFEVQTASDTTYRLYDWSRETGVPPRALHLEEAESALDLSLVPRWSRAADRAQQSEVFTSDAFDLHALPTGRHDLGSVLDTHLGPRAIACFPLDGAASVRWPGGEYELPFGRVTIVPAAIAETSAVLNNRASVVLTVLVK